MAVTLKSKKNMKASHKGTQQSRPTSKKGKALGQAPALPLKMWKEWLNWLLETAGPKIFFVVFLTGAFGLRCGEAVALKREDLNLEAGIPKLVVTGESAGALQSPGEVYVRKQHVQVMRKWLREGIPNIRKKKHTHGNGEGKLISVQETFVIPKKGYLFRSRRNATRPFLHYHAVYDHMRRQAPKFLGRLQKRIGNGERRLPHSGCIQGGRPELQS